MESNNIYQCTAFITFYGKKFPKLMVHVFESDDNVIFFIITVNDLKF